jgi:hypothetical protein
MSIMFSMVMNISESPPFLDTGKELSLSTVVARSFHAQDGELVGVLDLPILSSP